MKPRPLARAHTPCEAALLKLLDAGPKSGGELREHMPGRYRERLIVGAIATLTRAEIIEPGERAGHGKVWRRVVPKLVAA